MTNLPDTEYFFANDEFFNPRLQLDSFDKKTQVEKALDCYRLTVGQVQKLRALLNGELQLGLQRKPSRPSIFPMVNTFVTRFPNGSEVGDFLGLDIGGSNLRIVYLKLTKVNDKIKKTIDLAFYDVPSEIRLGTLDQFFNHLASCTNDYVTKKNLKSVGKVLPLGFTFSFGYEQYAIDKGEITQMGIHTNVADAKGKDPVLLLQNAINALQLPVQVVALANDATSTLIYSISLDPQASIGLILGSGANVAYMERTANYGKISDPVAMFGYPVEKIVVNSEFIVFGDNGIMDFAKNKYDFALDNDSLTPHICTYEKITGGAFLGELLRYTLVDLVKSGLILNGHLTPEMTTPETLPTASISAIEEEFEKNGRNARTNTQTLALLKQLGYTTEQINEDDCAIVTLAGQLITVRSALFIASAISIFADHSDQSMVKVGCDGSLFKKHPKMSTLINAFANALSPNKKTEVFSADQGSGIGAAMLAATVAGDCSAASRA